MRRRAAPALLLLCALVLLGLHGLVDAARARAAPDAREAWVSHDLLALERLLHDLDGRRADALGFVARVWQLHQRLSGVEAGLGLRGGIVSRRSAVNDLLLDLTLLSGRVRVALVARAERTHPPSDGAVGGTFRPKPLDPSVPPDALVDPPAPWPRTLQFNATAKLNFEPFGRRYIGPSYTGAWAEDFLQEGTRGTLSFSLRARGLLKQMASARVRVVVRLLPPFSPKGGGFRVYDVEWRAERALSDNALRSWLEHETLRVHGPYVWLRRPQQVSRSLDVEAHVLSLTNAKGETITFEAPEYVRR